MNKFALLLATILFSLPSKGQSFHLPPVIVKLLEGSPVHHVNILFSGYLPIPIPAPHDKQHSTLVKTKDGLFACIHGTGMVYQLIADGTSGFWKRVDSTYFSGYNQAAFFFALGDVIYCFGGSGLFNVTGHLRYFNDKMLEWAITPLNREVLYENNDQLTSLWVDELENKLYLIGQSVEVPAITGSDPRVLRDIGKVLMLDVKKGIWNELGVANDTVFRKIANSPWGIIAFRKNDVWLVDYKSNRYFRGKESLNVKMFSFLRAKVKELSFMRDGKLFFGDYGTYIDSVAISRDEFENIGTPVYEVKSNGNTFTVDSRVLWVSVFGLLTLVILLTARTKFVSERRAKENAAEDSEYLNEEAANGSLSRNQFFKSTKDYSLLAEMEARVLRFLLEKSLQGQTTSIEELNKLLGVAQKNVDIQKRIRSEIIISINQKLALILRDSEPVIAKKRADDDKRSFEYYVRQAKVESVQQLIEQGNEK